MRKSFGTAMAIAMMLATNAWANPMTNVYTGAPNSGTDYDNLTDAIANTDAGGTVNVAAGNYQPAATISVNKSLTVLGPQDNVDPRSFAGFRSSGGVNEAVIDGTAMTSGAFFFPWRRTTSRSAGSTF